MNPTCKLAESSFKRRRQLVGPGAREQVYRTFPGADPNYTRRFAVQVASLDRTKPRQQLPQHQLVAQCYARESCLPTWSRPVSDRSPLTVNRANGCQQRPQLVVRFAQLNMITNSACQLSQPAHEPNVQVGRVVVQTATAARSPGCTITRLHNGINFGMNSQLK